MCSDSHILTQSSNSNGQDTTRVDKFSLAREAKIKIRRTKIFDYDTFNTPMTAVNGDVSGGGSEMTASVTRGFIVRIENVCTEPREYYYEIELFKNKQRADLLNRIKKRTIVLRPGQVVEHTIVPPKKHLTAILSCFQSIDKDNKCTESYAPNWDLKQIADPRRITLWSFLRDDLRLFAFRLMQFVMYGVIVAFFLGLILMFSKAKF